MPKAFKILLTQSALLIITLAACEIILRACGYTPWADSYLPGAESRPTKFHPEYGWFNIPGGRYGSTPVPQTRPLLPDGSRTTSMQPHENTDPDLLLIGDSLIFGAGLTDSETLGWLLADHYPSKKVVNFGVSGFSTAQSLLVMRDLLKRSKPKVIVYGYGSYLEERNVAAHGWQWSSVVHSRHPNSFMPWASLDKDGKLVEHKTAPYYPEWPLRKRLSLIALAEEAYTSLFLAHDETQKRRVSQLLIKQLSDEGRASGARVIVILLWEPTEILEEYRKLLSAEGVEYVVCVHPNYLAPDLRLPGDGHPTGEVNRYWRECLTKHLDNNPPPGGK